MAIVSMKSLLESGVHFGHRTNKWNPRMKPYIFTERNGIHIIDLQQTVKALTEAYELIRDTVANGGKVMFVGTKRQAQETIVDEATRCGMPYVTERWLGGMLTNWSTILQRIFELEKLEKMRTTGEIERLTKKEGLMIDREIKRLETRLSGVRNLRTLPDLLFVIDVSREYTAVHEANLKGIPVIAMVDTNCDPTGVDYVIPSNDDAIRAIKLMVAKIADAVIEGTSLRKDVVEEVPEPAARPHAPEAARSLFDEEEELEEDLLGQATLAKLSSARSQRAAEVSEEDESVEAEEEAPEEDVEAEDSEGVDVDESDSDETAEEEEAED